MCSSFRGSANPLIMLRKGVWGREDGKKKRGRPAETSEFLKITRCCSSTSAAPHLPRISSSSATPLCRSVSYMNLDGQQAHTLHSTTISYTYRDPLIIYAHVPSTSYSYWDPSSSKLMYVYMHIHVPTISYLQCVRYYLAMAGDITGHPDKGSHAKINIIHTLPTNYATMLNYWLHTHMQLEGEGEGEKERERERVGGHL